MDVQHQLSTGHLLTPGVPHDQPLEGLALGDYLRQARESRGLTLRQISHATKIPERHLDALEHGNLAAIPSGPYRRGEIKAYAQVVGLDATVALARLDGVLQPPRLAPAAPSESAPRVESQTRLVSRAGSIGVLGAIAVAMTIAWTLWSAGVGEFVTRSGAPNAIANQPASVVQTPAVATPPTVAASGAAEGAAAPATPLLLPGNADAAGTGDETLAPTDFNGVLVITSDPPGARVTVNGIGWGSTPVTIRQLTPGDKLVRLTGNGYAAVERVIRLSADSPTSEVAVTMQPAQ